MKKLKHLIYFLSITILFTACSSDDNPSNEVTVAGEWVFVNGTQNSSTTKSGIQTITETITTGDNNTYVFNENPNTLDVFGKANYQSTLYMNGINIGNQSFIYDFDQNPFENVTWEVNENQIIFVGFPGFSTNPNLEVIEDNTINTITTLTSSNMTLELSGTILVHDNETNLDYTYELSSESNFVRP